MFKLLFYAIGGSMLGNTVKQYKLRKERNKVYSNLYEKISYDERELMLCDEYVECLELSQIGFMKSVLLDKGII